MSNEEEIEWAKSIRDFLRSIYEDKVISESELSLLETPALHDGAPLPNTAHPALTHAQDFVREFNQNHVRIYMIRRAPAHLMDEMSTYPIERPRETAILTRSKACAGAPFVGDPLLNFAVYVWSIWTDDLGRHIAGNSQLVWMH